MYILNLGGSVKSTFLLSNDHDVVVGDNEWYYKEKGLPISSQWMMRLYFGIGLFPLEIIVHIYLGSLSNPYSWSIWLCPISYFSIGDEEMDSITGDGGRGKYTSDSEWREEEEGGWWGRRVQISEAWEEGTAEGDEEVQAARKRWCVSHFR